MKIDGQCHCGAIRYEADINPGGITICHCRDCQQLTGTAFRVVVGAREDQFTLVSGSPKTYVKTADSGAKRLQAFCADCGSPIYATSVEAPAGQSRMLGLRVGTIRQRGELKPSRQIWRDSALEWVPAMSHLETHSRQG